MVDETEVRQALGKLARDGQARCRSLLELAERLGVAPGVVGRLCDEMKIRIRGCQLGCFR